MDTNNVLEFTTESELLEITNSENNGFSEYLAHPLATNVVEGTPDGPVKLSLGNVEVFPRDPDREGIIAGCHYRVFVNGKPVHATKFEFSVDVKGLPFVKLEFYPHNPSHSS